jgi:hypothetical protein
MSSEFKQGTAIVLNVVLATVLAVMLWRRMQPSRLPPARETGAPAVAERQAEGTQVVRYPDAASAQNQRRWLADQLRALGVPNDTLARVVMASLDQQWNQQGAALAIKYHGDSDKMAAFQLEVDSSKDAEMRAALGEVGFRLWDQANMLRQVNQGNIPLTDFETGQAYDIWKRMQQRQLDFERANVEATMDPADINDAMASATTEFTQQMQSLLGDDRYAKSQQLDDGDAAARQQFALANPSNSQFQELLKAQQQFNAQRTTLDSQFGDDPGSPDYADQLAALATARDQAYQQVLGTNVFNTLQKQQDPGYLQMKQYESLWGLTDNQVDSTYAAIKYFQKAVQDYQSQSRALAAQGQPVDWDTVNKNLQQFADQTQQALQSYVGPAVYDKMQRNGVFQLGHPEMLGHTAPTQ